MKKKPYKIEIDHPGCKYCKVGRTWSVVGPDGFMMGQSWTEKAEAEWMASMCNTAVAYGMTEVIRKDLIRQGVKRDSSP